MTTAPRRAWIFSEPPPCPDSKHSLPPYLSTYLPRLAQGGTGTTLTVHSHQSCFLQLGHKLFLAPLDKGVQVRASNCLILRRWPWLTSSDDNVESAGYWNWNWYVNTPLLCLDDVNIQKQQLLTMEQVFGLCKLPKRIHACVTARLTTHDSPFTSHTTSDFADEFPNAEVIGTDVSPIQPSWIPPNLKL